MYLCDYWFGCLLDGYEFLCWFGFLCGDYGEIFVWILLVVGYYGIVLMLEVVVEVVIVGEGVVGIV